MSMREEFEAWASKGFGLVRGHFARVDDEYENFPTQCYWEVWQASRESMVIEWPDQDDYTSPGCAGAAILDCRAAYSKAAGLKVKP